MGKTKTSCRRRRTTAAAAENGDERVCAELPVLFL
jgi:hypothetical protein